MAKRLKDMYSPEEYLQLIEDVADYVIENNASTRQTARYFTENGIKISNNTVCTFLNSRLLKEISPEKFERVQKILSANSDTKTFQDPNVLFRMQRGVELLMQGHTVLEIAKELDSTVDIIYDDLTSRLKRLGNEELVKLVADELQRHKNDNLKNVNKKR